MMTQTWTTLLGLPHKPARANASWQKWWYVDIKQAVPRGVTGDRIINGGDNCGQHVGTTNELLQPLRMVGVICAYCLITIAIQPC